MSQIASRLARLSAAQRAVLRARLGRGAAPAQENESSADANLVAYVVPAPGSHHAAVELRRRLQARLPDHLVPSEVVRREELPRTPNGKLDVRALPLPFRAHRQPAAELVAPATSVERRLAEIWMAVLQVDRVGVHDDFFDLGG